MKSCKLSPMPAGCPKSLVANRTPTTSKQKLQEIFNVAHAFATRFFSEDLGDEVLNDSVRWKDLRDRINWLRLIRSNTSDAKEMRIAACLGELGSLLAELILVPVYLEPDAAGVKSLLMSLYVADKQREQYVRSVLLATPVGMQAGIVRDRIHEITEEIWRTFGRLIEEPRRPAFEEALMQVCRTAVECWEFARHARVKVDAFFPAFETTKEIPDESNDEYWLPIPLTVPMATNTGKQAEQAPSQKKEGPRQNGHARHNSDANSSTGGRHKQNGSIHESRRDEEPETTFDLNSIRRPVWPGYYVDDEVVKGYVLLNSQVKAAKEDTVSQRVQRQPRRGSAAQPKTTFLC